MENLILVSKDDLRQVISEILRETTQSEKQDEKQLLRVNDAVRYLSNKGLKISKQTLYNLTAKNEIPFRRFGEKQILFSPSELDEWVDERLGKKSNY